MRLRRFVVREPRHRRRSSQADCLFRGNTGDKPPNSRKFFRPAYCLNSFDANRYILANRYNMGNVAVVGVFNRHFADHSVPCRTVVRDCLLFNSLDTPGAKGPLKFLADPTLRIFLEHVKYVASNRQITRNSLQTDLAVPVPSHDPIIAVNDIKRDASASSTASVNLRCSSRAS